MLIPLLSLLRSPTRSSICIKHTYAFQEVHRSSVNQAPEMLLRRVIGALELLSSSNVKVLCGLHEDFGLVSDTFLIYNFLSKVTCFQIEHVGLSLLYVCAPVLGMDNHSVADIQTNASFVRDFLKNRLTVPVS